MRDERNEAAGQKLCDEQLDEVAGGFACPSADVPLYDWTKFDIAIARGVSNVPGGCLTISYEPDRPCNSGVGGWGEGEQVRVHPSYTAKGKDAVWRWGYRNGFYGWINGNYLG